MLKTFMIQPLHPSGLISSPYILITPSTVNTGNCLPLPEYTIFSFPFYSLQCCLFLLGMSFSTFKGQANFYLSFKILLLFPEEGSMIPSLHTQTLSLLFWAPIKPGIWPQFCLYICVYIQADILALYSQSLSKHMNSMNVY